MVSNDDGLVVVSLCCLNDVMHALVNSPHCFGNGVIDTSMSYHVTIGEVHDNEVILLRVDSTDKLFFYLVGTHLRLQVVGSNLW